MQHANSNEATNEAASIESPFRVKGQTCRLCKFQNKAENDRLKKIQVGKLNTAVCY